MENYLYWYRAYVIKVYDGDTITVNIDLGFGIIMNDVKIRLNGIDAPEIRGDEREDGLISGKWLSERILNKWVTIKTIKDKIEKYGRYLGEIYIDGVNLNELLMNEGLAKKYE
jgi:micrococcal nuclease